MIRIDNQFNGDFWQLEETVTDDSQFFYVVSCSGSGQVLGRYTNMTLGEIKRMIMDAVERARDKHTRELAAFKEIQECLNTLQ